MTNAKNLKVPRRFFSLTLPQVYDESLTYYEYMNKLFYAFNHIADYYSVIGSYDADTKTLTLSAGVNTEGSTEE